MAADGNKDLVRRLLEGLNDGRLDVLNEVVAEDYQQDNESVRSGREGLRALFERLRSAFPDLSVSVDELVADGDTVVAATTFRGTHQGDLPGVKATGRRIEVSSLDMYRVRDGRIDEHFGRFDELGMLDQLGVAHDLAWPGSPAANQ